MGLGNPGTWEAYLEQERGQGVSKPQISHSEMGKSGTFSSLSQAFVSRHP